MNEPLSAYLERILHADIVALDRWELKFFSIPEIRRGDSLEKILSNI